MGTVSNPIDLRTYVPSFLKKRMKDLKLSSKEKEREKAQKAGELQEWDLAGKQTLATSRGIS